MKEYFGKLFKYDHWANTKQLGFLESRNIKDEQIQKLMSHILNAEYIWLYRILEKGDPGKKVWDIHTFGLLTEMAEEIFILYKNHLPALTDKDFARVINYKTSQGTPFSNTIEDILSHVINHGTYHRGQINQLIRKKDLDPPIVDYIMFRRD